MLRKLIKYLISKSNTDFGILIVKLSGDNLVNFKSNYSEIIQNKTDRLKIKKNQVHQIADPFLIKYENDIWLFYEEKRVRQKGLIKSLCLTNQNSKIHNVDFNLQHKIHMSYPFVFYDNQQLFMIPESVELGEIGLYRCISFPNSWVKVKTIIEGNFVDTSIYEESGVYYLFTTEKVVKNGNFDYVLRLFYARSIVDAFKEHPASPIKVGRKFGRSGGAVVNLGNQRFRFSQDCSRSYGRELAQFRITKLNIKEYQEELITNNWIYSNFKHQLGGHHCSVILNDSNSVIVAVDLNYKEGYIQRFINKLLY